MAVVGYRELDAFEDDADKERRVLDLQWRKERGLDFKHIMT